MTEANSESRQLALYGGLFLMMIGNYVSMVDINIFLLGALCICLLHVCVNFLVCVFLSLFSSVMQSCPLLLILSPLHTRTDVGAGVCRLLHVQLRADSKQSG